MNVKMQNVEQYILLGSLIIEMYNKWQKSRSESKKRFEERRIMLLMKRQKYQALIAAYLFRRRRRSLFERSCWIRRELLADNHGKFWEACVSGYSDERFQKKFRLSRTSFQFICDELAPYLTRTDTIMRMAIPLPKRIAVAITMLKGTMDFWTIADLFGIGKSTVGYLLYEFCDAMIHRFSAEFIKFPDSEHERINISKGFSSKWQFPDCFGAMDGTHIPIRAPSESTEDYYNYKCFHSIVVLAIVDYNYRFIYSNVGAPGRCNDASIFRRSLLFNKFSNATDQHVKITSNLHIISDAAFPLLPWVLKPYPETNDMSLLQKNFNYRLSRARMTVENAFGRLQGRWRLLLKKADLNLEHMKLVIKTAIILHNICEKSGDTFHPEWAAKATAIEKRYGIVQTIPTQDRQAPTVAKVKRDMLAERLMNDYVFVDYDES